MFSGHKIILASGSPRRKELLEQMEVDFTVDTGNSFEEVIPAGMEAEKVPAYMAEGKSYGFHRPLEDGEVLVSADTIVICDGQILGKPHTVEKATEMLQMLSGKTHEVVSAICMRTNGKSLVRSDKALVRFRTLSDEEICHYVSRYNPVDKAGGYGIQEWIGLIGIERIEGSFYTIMGLPTHLFPLMLQALRI